VLPFIAVALGGPLLAATLIYPIFALANLVGAVATPEILARGRSSKFMLTVAVSGGAVFTAANALGVQLLGETMTVAFIGTAAALGFLAGVSAVCFLDVVGGVLVPAEQSRLPVLQSSISAVLVLTITLVDSWAFDDGARPSSHVRLLWFGAGALLVAAVSCLLIEATPRPRERIRLRDMLRREAQLVRDMPWLRPCLLVQTVFLTVSLGSAFYSAHGATMHGDVGGNLHLIVAMSSLGLLCSPSRGCHSGRTSDCVGSTGSLAG
jgi:hypothetical protein